MNRIRTMALLAACMTAILVDVGPSVLAQVKSGTASVAQPIGPNLTPEESAERQKAKEDLLHNDWPNLAKYRLADAELPAPAAGENRVVFMGDSITEGWGAKENPLAPGQGGFFPRHPYINRGISGQTSPQMLIRFRQDALDLEPRIIVILSGSNDIAGNTGQMRMTDTENNLKSMSDLAHAHGIHVIYCSVPPAKAFWWAPGSEPSAKIKALNTWIRHYAASQHEPYVDYYSSLVDEQGAFKSDLSADGVHPNARGYAVMAPLIQVAIDGVLTSVH